MSVDYKVLITNKNGSMITIGHVLEHIVYALNSISCFKAHDNGRVDKGDLVCSFYEECNFAWLNFSIQRNDEVFRRNLYIYNHFMNLTDYKDIIEDVDSCVVLSLNARNETTAEIMESIEKLLVSTDKFNVWVDENDCDDIGYIKVV